jgi:uncharacterized protein YcaQ
VRKKCCCRKGRDSPFPDKIFSMNSTGSDRSVVRIPRKIAARFLLSHQALLPPRNLEGKKGILNFFKRVGCIQFDPVNIVGRNPELVLQARVREYRPQLLDELLYSDHRLMDCWDKVSAICRVEDFPYFARHHQRMCERFQDESRSEVRTALELLELIQREGTFDPAQGRKKEMIRWDWGRPVRLEKAALEILYAMGKISIVGRVGSRRSFDAVERLIPKSILESPDPNRTLEDYHDWHVYRRLGGMGLGQLSAAEAWLGIQLMKTPERLASLGRLMEKKLIFQVEIEELPGKIFFMRRKDLSLLENLGKQYNPQASFLAPLDNLLWDRKVISMVFGFDYVWEIYKKPHLRQYGHYTLPVLFGERFIARFDPVMDRKSGELMIKNWWWEKNMKVGQEMQTALKDAVLAFMAYLGASKLNLTKDVNSVSSLAWLKKVK